MIITGLITEDNHSSTLAFDNGIFRAPEAVSDRTVIALQDTIAFPGLINSHDHLEFNLFPQLGDRIYESYKEWGYHLHANYQKEITAITRIPASLRVQWGIYKNLLAGVTTVLHHGPKLTVKDAPIEVYENVQCLHSLGFEKRWRLRLNNVLRRQKTCTVHIGEGTSSEMGSELTRLLRWNILRKDIVGIHGLNIKPDDARRIKALVWCPVSNQFLYRHTADIRQLKQYTQILLGTDSTLTSGWNIWEHIRQARQQQQLTDEELYCSLTKSAAAVWSLNSGDMAPGKKADIVIARQTTQQNFYDAFYCTNPENLLLVISGGEVRLCDHALASKMPEIVSAMGLIRIEDSYKYVPRQLCKTVRQIQNLDPDIVFPIEVIEECPRS